MIAGGGLVNVSGSRVDNKTQFQPSAELPPGCVVETLPGGSLRVTKSQVIRDAQKRDQIAGTVLFNGFLLAALALHYGASPVHWKPAQIWHDFGLVAAGLVFIDVLSILGAFMPVPRTPVEEWIARPDCLEHRIRWKLPWGERRTVQRFTEGELRLVHNEPRGVDESAAPEWELSFSCWRMRRGRGARGVIWGGSGGGMPEPPRCLGDVLSDRAVRPAEISQQMEALGKLLAEQTGWPLYLH